MNQLNQAPSSRERAHEDDQQEQLWEHIASEAAKLASSELSSLPAIVASAGFAAIPVRTLSITPRLLLTSDLISNSIQVTLELHMDLSVRNTTAQVTTH